MNQNVLASVLYDALTEYYTYLLSDDYQEDIEIGLKDWDNVCKELKNKLQTHLDELKAEDESEENSE